MEVPAKAEAESLPNAAHYLAQLQTLQATDGRTKRRAVHYFESLVDIGEDALPPIFRRPRPADVNLGAAASLVAAAALAPEALVGGRVLDRATTL